MYHENRTYRSKLEASEGTEIICIMNKAEHTEQTLRQGRNKNNMHHERNRTCRTKLETSEGSEIICIMNKTEHTEQN